MKKMKERMILKQVGSYQSINELKYLFNYLHLYTYLFRQHFYRIELNVKNHKVRKQNGKIGMPTLLIEPN